MAGLVVILYEKHSLSFTFLPQSGINLLACINKLKMYIAFHIVFGPVDSPGLTINVSRSALHTSDTKCLVIQCNFDSALTDIKTVTYLGMYGPKPYGQKADLVLFLEIYNVSKTPTVVS